MGDELAIEYGGGIAGSALVLDGVDDVVQLPSVVTGGDYSFSFSVCTTAIAPGGPIDPWSEGWD